jgi:Pyridoxamine 5'-phosphate oxidase
MATVHDSITEHHQAFIAKQHLFFVSTAPLSADGHVNLSPKGLDCFRVLSPRRVGYADVIGSGNEVSAHVLENGRITFMFCAFDGPPSILRLYGVGQAIVRGHSDWEDLSRHFTILPSTRQIIVADISRIQTSCGFGVPLFEYVGERDQHFKWASAKGQSGLEEYISENNQVSIDGLPTALGRAGRP